MLWHWCDASNENVYDDNKNTYHVYTTHNYGNDDDKNNNDDNDDINYIDDNDDENNNITMVMIIKIKTTAIREITVMKIFYDYLELVMMMKITQTKIIMMIFWYHYEHIW